MPPGRPPPCYGMGGRRGSDLNVSRNIFLPRTLCTSNLSLLHVMTTTVLLPRDLGEETMRKLLFALVMMLAGAFAFGAGTPANAMTAGTVAGMNDVVKTDGGVQKVYHWRRGFCWRYPYDWRCRHRGYRPYYYRRHYRHHRPWWY
jgi:hypothetical protein